MLENYLPAEIQWINQWLGVVGNNESGLNIYLSKYEDFCVDNLGHLEKILDWFNVPKDSYQLPFVEKNMSTHFRKGSKDEWRDVLSDTQKQRTSEMLEGLILNHYSK